MKSNRPFYKRWKVTFEPFWVRSLFASGIDYFYFHFLAHSAHRKRFRFRNINRRRSVQRSRSICVSGSGSRCPGRGSNGYRNFIIHNKGYLRQRAIFVVFGQSANGHSETRRTHWRGSGRSRCRYSGNLSR